MKIKISVDFVFNVPISEIGIAALTKLANAHYDGACKSAVQENGFICRWGSQIRACKECDVQEDDFAILATSYQLDICLKIMELPIRLLGDPAHIAAVADMKKSFRGATALANRNYNNWSTIYDS